MANYRVSTNANNSNKTKQDKTNSRNYNKRNKNPRKIDRLRLLPLKYDLLKISVDIQTVFAAETHLAEGQWLTEQLKQ
jgi:hypothetical protein